MLLLSLNPTTTPSLLLITSTFSLIALALRNAHALASPITRPARLLVLDTLVPNQRLHLPDAPPSFRDFLQNEPSPLVVVGREGLSIHARGVEVVVAEEISESSSLTLAATGRVAKILEQGDDEGSLWKGREGRVAWYADIEENDFSLSVDEEPPEATAENIRTVSERIGALAREWEDAVRVSGRERFLGQVDGILEQLGDIPDQPNRRALWVAGLINPLPALGVAAEIRPAVLTARTTSRRLMMAERGLRDSIDRIRRPGPCF